MKIHPHVVLNVCELVKTKMESSGATVKNKTEKTKRKEVGLSHFIAFEDS